LCSYYNLTGLAQLSDKIVVCCALTIYPCSIVRGIFQAAIWPGRGASVFRPN